MMECEKEDTMTTIKLQRAYEKPQDTNGYRVLVDRLWPRGIKKENLPLDDWLKDIAPSTELRKWFGHEVDKWDGFQEKFTQELDEHKAQLEQLLQAAGKQPLILVFAAKDEAHNNAVVIKQYLQQL